MIDPGWYATRQTVPPPLEGAALPRRGELGWTAWPLRVWPLDPLARAPRRVVFLTFGVGMIGTALWRPTTLSVGYVLVGVMVFAVVYGTADRRPTRAEWLGATLTLALLAVPALLAARWLGVLCIMAAWLVGWCTLVGGRTWTAVFVAPFMPWALPYRVAGWAWRASSELVPRGVGLPKLGRAAAVAAISAALVGIFGGLFAAADPAFAHVVERLVPALDTMDVIARVMVLGIVVVFALSGGYLMHFAPRLDALAPAPMRPIPRWEWAVPLGVLDALFVLFVAVQATVLFGGHDHVLETEGLTYAEYARQGFWQLLWVSALTLLVISVVIRVAGRDAAADRRLLRILVGTTCLTSVVVVISAIHRMWLYQQAYGFSVQRVMVIAIESWLGVVFVLVAVAGMGMTGRWLPRAVLTAGVLTLLGLAAINPERLIAEWNVDRYEQTGSLDADYLLSLSSDVEPVLARLPESMRQCARYRDDVRDPWYEFNLSRVTASHDGTPRGDECREYWTPGS
ncbi:DUF4173 domain-containing protein [Mycolicibacterium sp.]|uniref:DUF4153 domain-containing protein n=1 Tax=Mycolicibacterium sp. TaxID=2320850 RepID=UPI001A1869A1|nr:DUF4173 domain-containing protein [Mycolicibacterium sp.]MBJ7337630.1 DUF4173 domain-containing protein [Mycolicibacterium sp.]